MKITLAPIRPRNPFVAAALLRSAGQHRPGKSSSRQEARRRIGQELRQMKDIP